MVIVNELPSGCFKRIFSMFHYFLSPDRRIFALVYENTQILPLLRSPHTSEVHATSMEEFNPRVIVVLLQSLRQLVLPSISIWKPGSLKNLLVHLGKSPYVFELVFTPSLPSYPIPDKVPLTYWE